MAELPPKLFFRIGEVAGLVGVEPHVLRYWEREFRSIRPTKSAKGQRVYSRRDVENLLRVRDLLYRDGFTIAGAKKKLQQAVGQVDGADGAETLEDGRRATALSLVETPFASSEESEPVSRSVLLPEPARRDELASEPDDVAGANVREKLLALRGEVEDFLAELSTNGSPRPRAREKK